mmetsp:Transcript_19412/g.35050  ORF Transcript_19412/g.35050 Transcript_19412/m.35050 type:complete len:152 (-) Transcript_19412:404-859(-)
MIVDSKTTSSKPVEDLTERCLAQRQKQINFGKNTKGYQLYVQKVPKDQRRKKGNRYIDPVTPDIYAPVGKKCFDGLVRCWRRRLHDFDEDGQQSQEQQSGQEQQLQEQYEAVDEYALYAQEIDKTFAESQDYLYDDDIDVEENDPYLGLLS